MKCKVIIKEMKKRAYLDFKNQVEYAKHLGVSVALVNSVINGKKNPTKQILDDLGFEKKTQYVKK